MNRRDFISLVALAAAGSAARLSTACAQQVGMKRIGVLLGIAEKDPEGQTRLTAFR